MSRIVFILIFAIVLFSCGKKKQNNEVEEKKPTQETATNNQNNEWEEVLHAVAKFDSYDENRILESGQGFFVAEDLFVTRYSLISQATRILLTPFNETKKYTASKFVAVDRNNDLVILQVDSIKRKPIELFSGTAPNSAKSMYIVPKTGKTIQLFSGKVLNLANAKGTKLYRITNRIRPSQFGTPIFVSNKKAIGIAFSGTVDYQLQSFAIPSFFMIKSTSTSFFV